MERKELGLVGAAPLNTGSGTVRIQKGDMLRENSTKKVLRVVSVYRKYEGGEYFLECENTEPGNFGSTKFLPINELSLMN